MPVRTVQPALLRAQAHHRCSLQFSTADCRHHFAMVLRFSELKQLWQPNHPRKIGVSLPTVIMCSPTMIMCTLLVPGSPGTEFEESPRASCVEMKIGRDLADYKGHGGSNENDTDSP
eukprot:5145167-Amphidinium_carterae.1